MNLSRRFSKFLMRCSLYSIDEVRKERIKRVGGDFCWNVRGKLGLRPVSGAFREGTYCTFF